MKAYIVYLNGSEKLHTWKTLVKVFGNEEDAKEFVETENKVLCLDPDENPSLTFYSYEILPIDS